MLADDAAARAIFDDALLAQAPRGLIHVNMATVSVALAESLAHAHASRGIHYVAAPVMGRPDVAAAARLTIMAGGPAEAIDRVQPLFDAIGQKTPWPGRCRSTRTSRRSPRTSRSRRRSRRSAKRLPAGRARRRDARLPRRDHRQRVSGPVYEGYGSMIAERRYDSARFKARLGLKDVRLALEAGDAVSVPLPVARRRARQPLDALAHGGGEQDFACSAKSRCAARAAEPSRDRSPAHRHNRRFVFPYIDAEAGMNLHTWWLFVATVFVVSAIPARTCCW